MALVQSTSGMRGAVEIGVTNGRPALIEFLEVQGAGPTIVPKGRHSGWFDIGGWRLFLRCTGHGSPTVVFEGGLTTDWYDLQNSCLDPRGCAATTAREVPGAEATLRPPRGLPAICGDLHALLRAARVSGPFVLAGHSNSGLFTQLYASTHPRQVAGLVLIDAVHPAYHQWQLALLKPLLPPEVWEALRQEAMTPPHRLVDPDSVEVLTDDDDQDLDPAAALSKSRQWALAPARRRGAAGPGRIRSGRPHSKLAADGDHQGGQRACGPRPRRRRSGRPRGMLVGQERPHRDRVAVHIQPKVVGPN